MFKGAWGSLFSLAALALLVLSAVSVLPFSQAVGATAPNCTGSSQLTGCVDYTLNMCTNALATGNVLGSNGNAGCSIEPTDLFVSPVSHSIYISDANASFSPGENYVVMSGDTNLVTGGIPGTFLPSQAVYDQANNKVYLASYYGYPYVNISSSYTSYTEYVFVLDATSGAVTGNISIGTSIDNQNNGWGIALDPNNGYLYADAYTGTSGNVTVINTTTDSVVTTMRGFGACAGSSCPPRGVFYDPSSGLVYVGHEYASNITLIDPSTNTVVGSITNFPGNDMSPSNFLYDQKDGVVYASDYQGTVSVIGAKNDSVINTFGAVSYNQQTGQLAYWGGLYNGSSPRGMAYLPSLDDLYVANQGSDNVTVINCATNRIVGNVAVGSGPEGVVYDPYNGLLYVANSASDTISVMTPASEASTTTSVSTTTAGSTATQATTTTTEASGSSTQSQSATSHTASGSATTTATSGGGIPEFPAGPIAVGALSALVLLIYAAARRRASPVAETDAGPPSPGAKPGRSTSGQ